MDTAAELMREADHWAAYFGVCVAERVLGLVALRRVLDAAHREGRLGTGQELQETLTALRPRARELVQAGVREIHWEYHATFGNLANAYMSERKLSWADVEACLGQLEEEHRRLLRPKAFDLLDELKNGRPDRKVERERWIREFERAGASRGTPPQFGDLRQFFEEEWPELEGIAPKNQSATEFYALRGLKRDLDFVVARTFGRDGPLRPSSRVFFGTLASPLPYAEVRTVPDSDQRLIVLSRPLWLATGVASLIAARSTQLEAKLFPRAVELSPDPDLPELASALRALLAGDREEASYPPNEDPAKDAYWEAVDFAMKGFIFAHEYAHFLHGHFDPGERAAAAGPSRDPWVREYEADDAALELVVDASMLHIRSRVEHLWGGPIPADSLQAVTALPLVYALTGASLVLDLVDEMERGCGTFAQLAEAHPPTMLRIRRLWNQVGRFPYAKAVRDAAWVARGGLHLALERHSPVSRTLWVCKLQAVVLSALWEFSHADLEQMLLEMARCLRSGSDHGPARSPLESRLWHGLLKEREAYGPDAVAKQCEHCAALVKRDGLLARAPRPTEPGREPPLTLRERSPRH